MRSTVEVVEKQNDIIRSQSEIIDELYRLLLQHVSTAEISSAPAYQKMQEAADGIRSLQGKELVV